jgi:hypothetical protein
MKFRFIGTYTQGRTSINACGVIFEGNEPSDVDDADGIRRLRNNPEFEAVGGDEGGLSEINDLRAVYRALAGKNGGPRWDECTYREKIAALEAK